MSACRLLLDIGLFVLLTQPLLRGESPEASLRVLVTTPDGLSLPYADVSAVTAERGIRMIQKTGADGVCLFAALSPGVYTVTVNLAGYMEHSRQGVRLALADRQEILLLMERIPARGEPERQVKSFLEAEPQPSLLGVETLASSVSVVMDDDNILQLPLLNRNIYSFFLLQTGVTSQEATEARGLKFSVHGQRVSGSNYLLDGVDNNDITLTGPVTITSLEGIQEFRMTNSSFSADTGRATSFIAQPLTRAGTNTFHGGLFAYLGNDAFDANTSANNSNALAKMPLHQVQTGLMAGGPILKNKTYLFTSLEYSGFRFTQSQQIAVPTQPFIGSLPTSSPFRSIFAATPPVQVLPNAVDPDFGAAILGVPNRINTLLFTTRFDHNLRAGRDRLTARYTVSKTDERGSASYQGYPDIWATDKYAASNTMAGWTRTFEGGPVNDLRLGWSRYRPDLPGASDDRPEMVVLPVQNVRPQIVLGSSRRPGDQRENNNVLQLANNFTLRRGRSSITTGFEERRNFENGINLGLENAAFGAQGVFPVGIYMFPNLQAVQNNQLAVVGLTVDRFARPLQLADFTRQNRSTDYAAFVQDNLKFSRRLSVDVGLRWEHFGVIHDADRSKDINLYFGPGSTTEERIQNGVLRRTPDNPGDLKGLLYRPRWRNFAPSLGLAWDPFGRGQTIVRAGYAISYDRIYDTALDVRTNSSQTLACMPRNCPAALFPITRILPLIPLSSSATPVVIVDENLKTPYAENWHIGIQQNITASLQIQVSHAGSVGRKLASRDQVDRVAPSRANTQHDNFISNQGNSNFLSFETNLIGRQSRGLRYQVSYTWSHVIDNQSDLLEGVRLGPDPTDVAIATFTRELDPRFDRGSANFDQRHNFIVNAIWSLPTPRSRWRPFIGGWSVSGIGGVRSGFPVTVIASTSSLYAPGLFDNRVDVIGDPAAQPKADVPGGKRWLSAADFSGVMTRPGNLGRNALPGPGSWNCDLAIMRNFSFKESRLRFQFRSEFYNAFNHANLSAPVSDFTRSDFGVSYAGRSQGYSRFGELPLDNASRRIQVALRFSF